VLRTALQPRWLGLLAAVLAVMVTFGALGAWQLGVARDKGRAQALAAVPHQPVVPVPTVLQPHAGFPVDAVGRRVSATGRYDARGQVLVTPRVLHGIRGMWVVTPLVVASGGARLAVVRGFVRSAGDAGTPPASTVHVTGALAPSESPSSDATVTALPPGQVASVDLAALVNRWPGEVYNGFLLASDERPRPGDVGRAVVRVPPPVATPAGIAWRNAAYAFQWWIFAAFALYMWVRMVREESERGTHRPQPREAVRV